MSPVGPGESSAGAVPVVPARRSLLDGLRGGALFGMILVHVVDFLMDPGGAAEASVREWVWLLVQGKSRAAFAFLFGVSFVLLAERFENESRPLAAVLFRRLLMLYAVGWMVETFTRFQILREYAWWGLALLVLRGRSNRTLLACAALSAAAPAIRDGGSSAWRWASQGREATEAVERAWFQRAAAPDSVGGAAGSNRRYGEEVVTRFRAGVRALWSYHQFTPGATLAFFLIGVVAARCGLATAPHLHRAALLGWGVAGVGLWAAHHWLLPSLPDGNLTPVLAHHLRDGAGLVTDQALAWTYLGLGCLLVAGPWFPSVVHTGLAAAGRMAFSNYILQAAVIEFAIWKGVRLSGGQAIGAALAGFAVLMIASRLWLRRFRYGPWEWAWRSFTLGQTVPWRR